MMEGYALYSSKHWVRVMGLDMHSKAFWTGNGLNMPGTCDISYKVRTMYTEFNQPIIHLYGVRVCFLRPLRHELIGVNSSQVPATVRPISLRFCW